MSVGNICIFLLCNHCVKIVAVLVKNLGMFKCYFRPERLVDVNYSFSGNNLTEVDYFISVRSGKNALRPKFFNGRYRVCRLNSQIFIPVVADSGLQFFRLRESHIVFLAHK